MKKKFLKIFLITIILVSMIGIILFSVPVHSASVEGLDFSDLLILDEEYSYSTIFYDKEQTHFIVYHVNNANVSSPEELTLDQFKEKYTLESIDDETDEITKKLGRVRILPGQKFVMLITNCAMNEHGDVLDVLIKIDDVVAFANHPSSETPEVTFGLNNHYKIPTNQQNLAEGSDTFYISDDNPLAFHFGTNRAKATYTMTYYMHGTYSYSNNTGTLGNISEVNGLYWDIDVNATDNKCGPSGREKCDYSNELFDGYEGFKPKSTSKIYYAKTSTLGDPNYENSLRIIDDGIALESKNNTNTELIYVKSSAFMTTTITNSSFSFTYSGKSCGLKYAFLSPYPYNISLPFKKAVTKDNGDILSEEDKVKTGDKFKYIISQYIPNNYFGENLSFKSQQKTRYDFVTISDVIDKNLEIDQSGIKVSNELNKNVTSYFDTPSVIPQGNAGNKITLNVKDEYLQNKNFYSHTYNVEIPVTVKNTSGISQICNNANNVLVSSKISGNAIENFNISKNVCLGIKYTLTVNYYEQGTTNPVVASDGPTEFDYNQRYETSPAKGESTQWQYTGVSTGLTSGNITQDTVVNYYFQKHEYTLIVNYLEEGTNTPLGKSPTKETVRYGEQYDTIPYYSDFNKTGINYDEWEYAEIYDGVPTGTITGDTVVTYYFRKRSYDLTVKYLQKDSPHTPVAEQDGPTKYLYGTDYNTSPNKGVSQEWQYANETSGDATSGKITKNTEVIYYFEKHEYTLTVNYLVYRTGEPVPGSTPTSNKMRYGDSYNTSSYPTNPDVTHINYAEWMVYEQNGVRVVDGVPSGTITGDTVVNYYFVKRPYTLTINYLEVGTNKPIDTLDNINPKTKNPVYYNEKHSSDYNNVNLKKWRIVEADSTAAEYKEASDTHIITDVNIKGDTTVNYYFEKIPYTLTINYLEEGTNKPIDTLDGINPKITKPIYYDDHYDTDYSNVNLKKWRIIRSEVDVTQDSVTADDKSISGTLRGDTVVNYYFEKIPYNLTVNLYQECDKEKQDCSNWNYVLIDTLDNVNPKKTYPIYYDDKYETDYSNVNLKKWRITRSEVNITEDTKVSELKEIDGIIYGDTIVNYYFELIPYPVNVNYYDTETHDKIAESDKTIYYYDMLYYTNYDKINMDVWEYVSTDGDPVEGKITGDQESYTINYYFERLKYELVVNFYDDETKEKIDKSERMAYNFGDEYDTNYDKIDENYWEYVRTEGETPGVIDEDKEVDYYFNNKEYTLEVNYYDEETGEKIDETDISSHKYDDEYTTNDDKIDKKKWELVEEPENKEGTVEEDTKVNYYYRRRKYKITVNYYEEGTENKIVESREYETYYGDKYITDYSGVDENVWTLVEMPENYQGEVDGDIIVNYYFKQVVIENPPTGESQNNVPIARIIITISIILVSVIFTYRILLKRKIYKI